MVQQVQPGDRVRIVIPPGNLGVGSGLLYPQNGTGTVRADPKTGQFRDVCGVVRVKLDIPFFRPELTPDGSVVRKESGDPKGKTLTVLEIPSWFLEPEEAVVQDPPAGRCEKCGVTGRTSRHPVEARGVEYRTPLVETGRVVTERVGKGTEAVREQLLCGACASADVPIVETGKVVEAIFAVPPGWSKEQKLRERRQRSNRSSGGMSGNPYSSMRGTLDNFGNPE